MIHPGRRCARTILMLAALPLWAQAQEAQLMGVVTDAQHGVVRDAEVSAVHERTGQRHRIPTDSTGRYHFSVLRPGRYKVMVRHPGFLLAARTGVPIGAGQRVRLDVRLEVSGTRTAVQVEEAAAHSGDPAQPAGIAFRQAALEELPMSGGNPLPLFGLAAPFVLTPAAPDGVGSPESGQFSVNGQRANSNAVLIDGVRMNLGVTEALPRAGAAAGGALPAFSAVGSLRGLVSFAAVEEVRLEVLPLAAADGSLPGGLLSLKSLAGTRSWHGGLTYRFRHQALDANDWFANSRALARAPLALHDGAAVLGGPLGRHWTFLAAYERQDLQQPLTLRTAVPSPFLRVTAIPPLQPLLAAFPAPNGPDLGQGAAEFTATVPRPATVESRSLRLDHNLTARVRGFVRYQDAPSSATPVVAAPWLLSRSRLRFTTLTGGMEALAGRVLWQARLGGAVTTARASLGQQPIGGSIPLLPEMLLPEWTAATPPDLSIEFVQGGVSLTQSAGRDRTQGQVSLALNAGAATGRHTWKAGGEFYRVALMTAGSPQALSLHFASFAAAADGEVLLAQLSRSETVPVALHQGAGFVQDTWRVSNPLTLHFGLRWEWSPAPASRDGRPLYNLIGLVPPATPRLGPAGAPLWRAAHDLFAPRLGAAWQMPLPGRPVLRAGGGLFYDLGFGAAAESLSALAPYSATRIVPAFPWRFGAPHLRFPDVPAEPPFARSVAFAADYAVPRVWQWHATWSQPLGTRGFASAAYVGTAGDRLLRREVASQPARDFRLIEVNTSGGVSRFHALQMQAHLTVREAWRVQGSYQWARSIDNGSRHFELLPPLTLLGRNEGRGDSSFDVRQQARLLLSWQAPRAAGWAVDVFTSHRTAFPLDVRTSLDPLGVGVPGLFRPDRRGGVPVWRDDATVAGGRRLNPEAFALPVGTRQGSLGRNALRGFPFTQVDVAVRREFSLRDRGRLHVRLEVFNALNRPNFGDPVTRLGTPQFGQSVGMLNQWLGGGSAATGLNPALQVGGARNVQLTARWQF